MTTVVFTNNYSDLNGSYRNGWKASLPEELAKQLIDSGTAKPADEEPVTPPPVTEAKAKRSTKAKPEQYVAPSTPEA